MCATRNSSIQEVALEATTNTPKRTRTVRASHPANAFRQEAPGLARSTFGFLDDDDIGWLKARVEDWRFSIITI